MLYKLLLVDDEEAVRKSICEKTPWESYGFTVIGEASNGIEALEMIDELHPDVVITDIRMPYLDGMELIKRIRASFPPINIIILSGYDEFTYAQQAIRYNVSEYVLKPVTVQELCHLLKRLKTQMDNVIENIQDKNRLENVYKQALPMLREKFLISLLSPVHPLVDSEIIAKGKEYGYVLDKDEFTVATFESNDSLKELAMLQVTEDTLKEQIPSLVFQYENQVVIIFYKDSNKYPRFDSLFKKEIYRALDSLYAYLERYFGNNTVIGVGSLEHAPSSISTSYKNALKALNYNAFNPDQHVLFINDMEKSSTKADSLNLEKYESDLLSMVKLGTREQVADCINVLGDQIVSLNADELSSFVLELLVAFDQLAQSYGTTLAKIVGDGRNLFEEVGTIHNAAKARRWFTSLALTIRDQLSGQRQSSHIKFVEDAKRLIGQHYQEPGFGLDQVCDMTNVSPAYFSSVFKKEIGSSFVQYLTNARLARAKELLVKTENKTYEIATAVGFTEPNYFSFCFKRYEGISPSQYRHQNKDEKH